MGAAYNKALRKAALEDSFYGMEDGCARPQGGRVTRRVTPIRNRVSPRDTVGRSRAYDYNSDDAEDQPGRFSWNM